jgi:flavodoxin
MKTLLIYDSVFENTAAVARAIGTALAADVQYVRDADPRDAAAAGLLVVGSPTHGGRPTPAIATYLKSIPDDALKQARVAAFDTRIPAQERSFLLRVLMRVIGYAAPRISKELRSKGGTLLAPPEGFIVEGKEGPLKAGELDRAATWLRVAA